LSNFNIYLERVQESRNYIYDESLQWEQLKRDARQIYVGLNMLLAAVGFGGLIMDLDMQKNDVEQRFKRDALEYVSKYKDEGIIKDDNTLDVEKIKKLGPYRANKVLDNLNIVLNRIPEQVNVDSNNFQEIVKDINKRVEEENERVKKEQNKAAQDLLKENPNRRLYDDSL
jgi:hypothetical protein